MIVAQLVRHNGAAARGPDASDAAAQDAGTQAGSRTSALVEQPGRTSLWKTASVAWLECMDFWADDGRAHARRFSAR